MIWSDKMYVEIKGIQKLKSELEMHIALWALMSRNDAFLRNCKNYNLGR